MGVGVLVLVIVALAAMEVRLQAIDSGMTDEIRDVILLRHNLYRSKVMASNMLQLRWNTSLEEEAAKWVNSCIFAHQDNPPWGENMFRSNFIKTPLQITMQGLLAWDLESSFVREDQPCCDVAENSTLCCSYSQMVWAKTRSIGCAIKLCDELVSDKVDKDTWYLDCYYYPPGNVQNETAYEKRLDGATCFDCPQTYTQCERNLCVPAPWCKNI